MITASQFKDRFPQFLSISDSRINLFIGDAALSISADKFGLFYDLAVAYLAAHMLTMADRSKDGAVGPVTSETVGELSRSFSDSSGLFAGKSSTGIGSLGATPFGVEYERIRRQVMITPMVTCR